MSAGGPREVRLRQRQTLREIREEGLTLDMQQYVTDQKDKNFTRAVLAALQCKIHDAHAAKEAALCDARQSKHAAQEASKHSSCLCTHDLAHYACASTKLAVQILQLTVDKQMCTLMTQIGSLAAHSAVQMLLSCYRVYSQRILCYRTAAYVLSPCLCFPCDFSTAQKSCQRRMRSHTLLFSWLQAHQLSSVQQSCRSRWRTRLPGSCQCRSSKA